MNNLQAVFAKRGEADASLEGTLSAVEMSSSDVAIRLEIAADQSAVYDVNREAFGRTAEAALVEALRAAGHVVLSLVAWSGTEVIGHLLLSPVTLSPASGLRLLGLGPVAVRRSAQQRGVGSKLVTDALGRARALGWQAVVVLGDPKYYRRFGFGPASSLGLTSEYDVPDEAFMVAELQSGVLRGVRGVVRYQPEFSLV